MGRPTMRIDSSDLTGPLQRNRALPAWFNFTPYGKHLREPPGAQPHEASKNRQALEAHIFHRVELWRKIIKLRPLCTKMVWSPSPRSF